MFMRVRGYMCFCVSIGAHVLVLSICCLLCECCDEGCARGLSSEEAFLNHHNLPTPLTTPNPPHSSLLTPYLTIPTLSPVTRPPLRYIPFALAPAMLGKIRLLTGLPSTHFEEVPNPLLCFALLGLLWGVWVLWGDDDGGAVG